MHAGRQAATGGSMNDTLQALQRAIPCVVHSLINNDRNVRYTFHIAPYS